MQSFIRWVVLRFTCGNYRESRRDCLRSEVKVQCCSPQLCCISFLFLARSGSCASWLRVLAADDPSVKRIGFPLAAMTWKQAIRMASHSSGPVGLPISPSFNPMHMHALTSHAPPIPSRFCWQQESFALLAWTKCRAPACSQEASSHARCPKTYYVS